MEFCPTDFGQLPLARAAVGRVAELRADSAYLESAWRDSGSRVLVLYGSDAGVDETGDGPVLRLVPPHQAPDGERFFLGQDEDGAYFAVMGQSSMITAGVGQNSMITGGVRGLRELGPLLGDRDAGLLVAAVALANWHATHTHCSRCGGPTVVESGGWTRRCPGDGSEHYPRTDPAVIMAVTDSDDRLLLGHAPQWPERRYSTLAGFVEPGESLEQAVRREVAEESGVVVGEVAYRGSQPWPFPSSLMVAFRATALTTDIALSDELSDARWFTRKELGAAVAASEVLPPGQVSIARRLIEDWYGAPLPG